MLCLPFTGPYVCTYRQVLGVRAVDASEAGLSAGSAVNLLAVDAQRLMDTAGSLHELWGLPFQVRSDKKLLSNKRSRAVGECVLIMIDMVVANFWTFRYCKVNARELSRSLARCRPRHHMHP